MLTCVRGHVVVSWEGNVDSPTFPRPDGRPTFTAPWFRWFLPKLTLPEGGDMRWEGHTLLMTHEFFTPELVHLLVLIPKSNQKTTWEAALAVWHLLTVPAPRAYCGAADKEQATELFDFTAHFSESEPELARFLRVRPSTKEIRHSSSPGRSAFKVLASDDSKQGGKKQGKNLTLAEADELHAWENRNLFVDLRSGGFKRRDAAHISGDPLWWTLGKMATITTEGYDDESVLAEEVGKFLGNPKKETPPLGTVESGLRVLPDGTVEKHPDGRLTIARYGDGRNVLLRWACEPTDDTNDSRVVKLANPASTATVDSIEDARTALTPWEFLRYRCNIRTLAFESWIPAGSWAGLYSSAVPVVEHRYWNGATDAELNEYIDSLYPAGVEIVGFIDMARYRDCAAITLIGPGPSGRLLPRTIAWRGSQDAPVAYGPVYAAARRLSRRYFLRALGLDPKYLDEMYETLEGDGLAVENFPQSNERMAPAAGNLRQAILTDRAFEHDGDPILTAHVMAAVAKDVGTDSFKLVKSKDNGPPIDACVALAGAFQLAGDLPGDFWVAIR